MASKKIPQDVATAMELAKTAGWNVSIRNDKVGIIAPDGVKLTVGFNPNDESMKIWRSNARKYNLVGTGPARTPDQSEELLKTAEEAGLAEAEQQNRKRQAFEAEQATKRREAEEAAQKAAVATAQGLIPAQVKVVEKAQKKVVQKVVAKSVIVKLPEFDSSLLGSVDYPKFEIEISGQKHYYCIECLAEDKTFTSKNPQGLASHRGFRHRMYSAGGAPEGQAQLLRASSLPEEIQAALELLTSTMEDHLEGNGDPARIAELEGELETLRKTTEAELSKADKHYTEAKAAFDKAIEAQKAKVHELTAELTGKTGAHEAETKLLMKNVEQLLTQVRSAINELSPAQAVGRIDQLLSTYAV